MLDITGLYATIDYTSPTHIIMNPAIVPYRKQSVTNGVTLLLHLSEHSPAGWDSVM